MNAVHTRNRLRRPARCGAEGRYRVIGGAAMNAVHTRESAPTTCPLRSRGAIQTSGGTANGYIRG